MIVFILISARQVPFRIMVKTDGDEAYGAIAANAVTNEQVSISPTFYVQFLCMQITKAQKTVES
jgi:hypothetical protein